LFESYCRDAPWRISTIGSVDNFFVSTSNFCYNKLMGTKEIAIFKGQKVRRTIYNNEWWFVISDVIQTLTDSVNIKDYITKMRKRDIELEKGWGQIVTPLEMQTSGQNKKLLK